jgi:uncharacterized membrane protein (UPF0127 family)
MAYARLIVVLSLVFAIIVFAALSLGSCHSRSGSPAGGAKKTERVVIGGHPFELEVSADPASRELGLMHRTSIDEHGGMLFIFPDSGVQVQGFWMKNCLVDMDILYLDPRGKITAMHRMKAQPLRAAGETEAAYEARIREHSYSSGYPAQFAIELKSGWLDQLNLKVEDQLPLDLDRLKAMAR